MSSGDYSRIGFDPAKSFVGVLMQQGRVQLDADWNEQVEISERRFRVQAIDIMGQCAVPNETPDGFEIRRTPEGHFTIGKGRIYVDGLMAENRGNGRQEFEATLAELYGNGPIPYLEDKDGGQPYYPTAGPLPDQSPFLFYVDVWQREVTYLEEPNLVEKAVGVDTTARLQTVWQVKTLVGEGIEQNTTAADLKTTKAWQALIRPSRGRLSTRNGRYRGHENRLYRVEIHGVPSQGQPTFKWSRDNAAIATAVTSIDGTILEVARTSWDFVRRFNRGDWIEITDDRCEFSGTPGPMRKIKTVDESARTIEIEKELEANAFELDPQKRVDPRRHTRIRRWDHRGGVKDHGGNVLADLDDENSTGVIPLPSPGVPVELEDGVQVVFDILGEGNFLVGDYWVFAVRTDEGYVEPLDHAPPRGIHHHYGGLALFKVGGYLEDFRTKWPPPSVKREARDTTVYVTEGSHNGRHFTIQNAIDQVRNSGGTVSLGPGVYVLREPVRIEGAKSAHLKGQGWKTILKPETRFRFGIMVCGSLGVAIESLAIVQSGQGGDRDRGAGVGVLLESSTAISVERCYFSEDGVGDAGPSSAAFWDIAVALAGRVNHVAVRGNFLAGNQSIGEASSELASLLRQASGRQIAALTLSDLCYRDNVFWSKFKGNRFEQIMHRMKGRFWKLRHCHQ